MNTNFQRHNYHPYKNVLVIYTLNLASSTVLDNKVGHPNGCHFTAEKTIDFYTAFKDSTEMVDQLMYFFSILTFSPALNTE